MNGQCFSSVTALSSRLTTCWLGLFPGRVWATTTLILNKQTRYLLVQWLVRARLCVCLCVRMHVFSVCVCVRVRVFCKWLHLGSKDWSKSDFSLLEKNKCSAVFCTQLVQVFVENTACGVFFCKVFVVYTWCLKNPQKKNKTRFLCKHPLDHFLYATLLARRPSYPVQPVLSTQSLLLKICLVLSSVESA